MKLFLISFVILSTLNAFSKSEVAPAQKISTCQEDFENEQSGFLNQIFKSDRNIFKGLNLRPNLKSRISIDEKHKRLIEEFNKKDVLESALDYSLSLSLLAAKTHQAEFDETLRGVESFKKRERLAEEINTFMNTMRASCSLYKKEAIRDYGKGPANYGTFANFMRTTDQNYNSRYYEGLFLIKIKAETQLANAAARLFTLVPYAETLLYAPTIRNIFSIDSEFVKKCIHPQEKNPITEKQIRIKDIKKSILEINNLIKTDIEELQYLQNSLISRGEDFAHTEIRELLKYKPFLLGHVLTKTLSIKAQNDFADFICSEMNSIYRNDKIWNVSSLVTGMLVGTITGVATMGLSPAAIAFVGGSVVVAEGVILYSVESHIGENILSQATVAKITGEVSDDYFVMKQAEADDRDLTAILSAASIVTLPISYSVKSVGRHLKTKKLTHDSKRIQSNHLAKVHSNRELPVVQFKELHSRDAKKRFKRIKKFMRKNGYLKRGEDLSVSQQMAIISAHKVGGKKKGFFQTCLNKTPGCKVAHNYSEDEIVDKLLALRGQGRKPLFPKAVREYSLRSGVTGNKIEKSLRKYFNEFKETVESILSWNLKKSDDFEFQMTSELAEVIKKKDLATLSKEKIALIDHCVKRVGDHLNCNEYQLKALKTLLDSTQPDNFHPYYYTQIIESLADNPTEEFFRRRFTLVQDRLNYHSKGKIENFEKSYTKISRNRYIVNATGDEIPYNGLIGEEEAIKILEELGLNARNLPDSYSALKKLGMLDDYVKIKVDSGISLERSKEYLAQSSAQIRKEEDNYTKWLKFSRLGKTNSPAKNSTVADLLLDDNLIADIYSFTGNKVSAKNLVDNILLKTEEANFVTRTSYGEKLGKRQTNRVFIYLNKYDGKLGELKELGERVRQKLGKKEPRHLQEAIIITRDKAKKPISLPVWP